MSKQVDRDFGPRIPHSTTQIRLSLQTWLSLFALGMVLWLALNHASLIIEMMAVLFGAFIVSAILRPFVDAMGRWRIPRPIAALGAYLGLLGFVVLVVALLVPVINAEVTYFKTHGPQLAQTFLDRIKALPWAIQWLPTPNTLTQNFTQQLNGLVNTVAGAIESIGGFALDLLLVLVLGYFLAVDAGLVTRLLVRFTPAQYRARVQSLSTHLRDRLSLWIGAQAVIALYYALSYSIGLSLLGVPFAFLIGFGGGLLEVIPYVGGIIAASLAVLSSLTVNPWLALWAILLHLGLTEIEIHVLAPTLYGRVLKLHPALVLVAMVVGAKAGGFAGFLYSVPVAVGVTVLLEETKDSHRKPTEDAAAPTPSKDP